ncbi:LuxR family transcriptional regulator [Nocardioides sp. B-3]|uniref:LuxR family transcriptional regulator n=1 Tax=Nocardioides sp. B-3 TaxID=2895565 RepID=UPI0021526A49|nr:LuxR family transcriptional regulator [Nocardioides sp. B-3]UUZ61002.1 LuxR C-terminal-related transcriptional regulator [Nocardioides sp. B-3]
MADTGGPVATYRMLGVVRAYAQSRLDATELGVVRDAQLDAALTAVAELAPLLTTDKDTWRAEIRQLYPNLRSATAWGLSRADPSRGRRLAAGLAWWWHLESGGREGLRFLERAVELGAGERNLLRAEVPVSAAPVADTAVGGGAGYRYAEAAAGLAGELVAEDDRQGQAPGGVSRLSRALVAIGPVGTDPGAAERVAVAVRDEAMTAGDGFVTDAAQALVGLVTMLRDVYPDAIDALEAPLASLLARGDRGVASMALGALAMANARCMRFRGGGPAGRGGRGGGRTPAGLPSHRFGLGARWPTSGSAQGGSRTPAPPPARIDGVVQGADPAPFIPRYELTHAILALEEGRLEEAVAWCRRESRWSSEPSEANLTVRTQLVLAIAQIWLGDHAAAAVVVERLQSSEQAPRLPLYWAESLNVQAILLHDADPEAALDLHLEALRYGLDSDFDMGLIYCLEAIIACHLHRGDLDRAAVLTGAVDRGREESGFWASSYVPDPRRELGERMPEAPLIDALARGRSMDLRRAAARVTRSRGPRRRPGAGWASLTPTEVEVATPAAEGLTNPQIAERLFVSRSTVKTHLEHVYAKLGIAGRTELARMVAERDGRR